MSNLRVPCVFFVVFFLLTPAQSESFSSFESNFGDNTKAEKIKLDDLEGYVGLVDGVVKDIGVGRKMALIRVETKDTDYFVFLDRHLVFSNKVVLVHFGNKIFIPREKLEPISTSKAIEVAENASGFAMKKELFIYKPDHERDFPKNW